MLKQRPLPHRSPHGGRPRRRAVRPAASRLRADDVNRILIWGLFGLGFDILFGFTGLLSFGQSAFFGTGGMVAAYLLTQIELPQRHRGARSSARSSRRSSAIWSA